VNRTLRFCRYSPTCQKMRMTLTLLRMMLKMMKMLAFRGKHVAAVLAELFNVYLFNIYVENCRILINNLITLWWHFIIEFLLSFSVIIFHIRSIGLVSKVMQMHFPCLNIFYLFTKILL